MLHLACLCQSSRLDRQLVASCIRRCRALCCHVDTMRSGCGMHCFSDLVAADCAKRAVVCDCAADDDNDAVLFEKIKSGNYDADDPIWENISDEAKDVVAKLLTVRVSQQPYCLRRPFTPLCLCEWVKGLVQ